MATDVPKRLYKYRGFSPLTLAMLVNDTVFYADPTTFNDPLDTKPNLDADVSNEILAKLLTELMEERVRAELSAAARTIHYSGPKTIEHVARHSRRAAARFLSDIRYNAMNPENEIDDPEQYLLAHSVQEELLRRYETGIYSLAERANCPLMWSHYGDQHRGICLGYSVPEGVLPRIHKMKYGGARLVQASDVQSMLAGDANAKQAVDEAVLLKKARPWAYEREWRLIGSRGEHESPLELEEIVFGMRCPTPVRFAIMRSLAERERDVRFYEIRGQHGRFLLDKRVADTSELAAELPRRAARLEEWLDDLSDEEAS